MKPRVLYQELAATIASQQRESTLADFKEHTIAYACQWRIEERAKPGARRLGESLRYQLLRIQRETVGSKLIPQLKPQDFIDHGRIRIASGVKPSTVLSDITAIRSTVSDYIASNGLPDPWLMVFKTAKHLLNKEQLIGKSMPRDRLPTLEELALLRAFFAKQNEHPNCITDMVLVLDGLVLTGRRISELCRIERQHVNVEKKTYWVYDLKNSKGKGYHRKAALIEGAWELFERRLAEIPNVPSARLFAFNPHTCSQRATKAKKRLQKVHPELFKDLRMHDDRAMCFTTLLKLGYTATQIQNGVSLHTPGSKVLDRHYLRLTADDLHDGPAGAPIEHRA